MPNAETSRATAKSDVPFGNFSSTAKPGRGDAISADGCLKTIQQRLPLGGIGALGPPEMAHIVALVHELGGCELHRGARWRRETRCHLREPRDQFDRRDQKPSRTVGLIVLLNEPM